MAQCPGAGRPVPGKGHRLCPGAGGGGSHRRRWRLQPADGKGTPAPLGKTRGGLGRAFCHLRPFFLELAEVSFAGQHGGHLQRGRHPTDGHGRNGDHRRERAVRHWPHREIHHHHGRPCAGAVHLQNHHGGPLRGDHRPGGGHGGGGGHPHEGKSPAPAGGPLCRAGHRGLRGLLLLHRPDLCLRLPGRSVRRAGGF